MKGERTSERNLRISSRRAGSARQGVRRGQEQRAGEEGDPGNQFSARM